MELGVLAEGLGQCDSSDCDKVLDLRNTESETRSGLGSLLWVRCTCGELNRVPTGKSHREKDKGPPIYDVNSKMATAMIHAGLSSTAVERFLRSLEIPPPDSKTLKRREREIGPAIERIADVSCKRAT